MEDAQQQVAAFIQGQGLSLSPEVRMLDVASEIGELAKEVLKGTGYGAAPWAAPVALQEEMGDCLFSLLALCSALELDAGEALSAALRKYARRAAQKGSIGSGR